MVVHTILYVKSPYGSGVVLLLTLAETLAFVYLSVRVLPALLWAGILCLVQVDYRWLTRLPLRKDSA